MVLHRLEGADGAAELHAFFRIGDRRLGAGQQDAHRLRGAQRAGQGPSPPGGTGHHFGVGHAHRGQGHCGRPAGWIKVPARRDQHALRSCAHQHHVVTQAEQQEVGRSPSQHDARLPVEQAVGQGQPPVQSDRAGDRAICQSGKQRRLQLGPSTPGHQRGCQHRGQEGSGRHLAADLLEHDDQLAEAGARSPVLLGEVDAQPTEVGHLLPKGRPGLVVRLEQSPAGRQRAVGRQDAPHGGAKLLVLVGDGDRHAK